jgi:hypothetical protein
MRPSRYLTGGDGFCRNILRTVDKSYITSTSAALGAYSFTFKLSDTADYTSFTNVFDQYKIMKVEFIVEPVSQPQLPGSTASWSYAAICIDRDDATSPASMTEILSYNNAITIFPGQARKFSFVPCILTGVESGGSTALSAPKTQQWLDCAAPNITHYGVKAVVLQSTSTHVNTWYCFARYHLAFRASR